MKNKFFEIAGCELLLPYLLAMGEEVGVKEGFGERGISHPPTPSMKQIKMLSPSAPCFSLASKLMVLGLRVLFSQAISSFISKRLHF